MKDKKLVTSIKISLLGVMAFLIMFIELPIPLFPAFLKLDLSDLPALIGAFAMGPVSGVVIELLKNILHGIFRGNTAFIGEFANFAVGSIMVYIAGYMYKRKKTRKSAIVSLITGTLIMSVSAGVLNMFVLLPLYEKILGFPMPANLNQYIVFTIVPFNIVKGAVVSVITLAIYKKVSPVLHKEEIDVQSKEVIN